jgi:hypothetical protein
MAINSSEANGRRQKWRRRHRQKKSAAESKSKISMAAAMKAWRRIGAPETAGAAAQ